MKTNLKLSLTFISLAAAIAVHAQSPATTPSSGLLGQRYAELGVGVINPHGISDEGFTGDLSVNLPVQAGLDVGIGYSYTRINADLFSGAFNSRQRDHTLYSSVTAYRTVGGVKPFVGAALAYQWSKHKLSFGATPVLNDRDDEALWGLGAGVEIPAGVVTVTPTVTYQDGFKRGSVAGFSYGAEVHTWFTRTLGGFAGVAYSDPTGGGTQSWNYQVGARLRF